MTMMDTLTIADRRDVDADSFIAWAMERPDCEHYELHDGVIVSMPNETSLHGEVKALIARRLGNASEDAGIAATVFVAAMPVQVSERTAFEPDVVVRLGDRLPPLTAMVLDPVIAVEVLSRSSRVRDFRLKQRGYLALPSLHQYLVVDPEERTVTHHRRRAHGGFETLSHGDDPIILDPPGIALARFLP
jgi:Uma2 family endonuclease